MLSEIDWNAQSIAIVSGCAIPVVAIVSSTWYKLERAKTDNKLKQQMVERGMSADEIERVVSAASSTKEDD
ncbi:MAG: hypothetical protein O7F76_11755 [Planctomycetota bacterium]|nr:hypothetical protein [Planctomycetota bacterium]